jgi:FkbM family methyltransferase
MHFTSWVPGTLWARNAGAHLRWVLRQSKADSADRSGRPFRYVHPIVGSFVYHPSDYLSRRVFLHDNFEREELRFAIDRSRAGGTILDVGANIGLYTVACAHAAGDRGRLIALEPGPRTFRKLTETCALLELTNVTLLQLAAGRASGTALLVSDRSKRDVHQHLVDARPHDPEGDVQVESRRLDDVCGPDADAVTLMKIDVEGHELEVLAGAERILTNGSVQVIVEFSAAALAAAGASSERLWEFLARTHRCIGTMGEDGAPLVPTLANLTSCRPDVVFNTLWVPLEIVAPSRPC